jgi:exopolysaccharide production protein ExoQ
MASALDDRLTTPAKIAGALGIGFGFFAGAGVTGLSMLIGLVGIWALVYGLGAKDRPLLGALGHGIKTNWLVWAVFIAFVGWVMASAIWSPAKELAGESLRRIAAMAILAPLAVWASAQASPTHQDFAHKAILAGLGIALFILLFETLTNASINRIASPEKEPLAIAGDLGRAATATLALFWVGFACLKRRLDDPRIIVGFVGGSALIAFQFGTDLNAVGIILGSVAALFALAFPRLAIALLSGACGLIMICAPLLYPLINKVAIALAPGGQLPLSYGRRAQMWQAASELIAQKPIMGWGLGAGSTFDQTVRYGGFDWQLLQLHPHAAPLHIWLETGAIGAGLAAILIVAAGGAAIAAFGRQKAATSALVGGLTFLAINWAFSHAAWREWMWTSLAVLIAFALTLRMRRRAGDSGTVEL